MGTTTHLRTVQKTGEKPGLDRHWRGLFLDTLAETSNVSAAAREAGINPSRAYKVRREEPAFRAKWYEALLEGYELLELETLHRLRMGVDAGKEDRKFDIANALRILMMHRETVARERAQHSHGCRTGAEGVLRQRGPCPGRHAAPSRRTGRNGRSARRRS
ncbi:hypothetical protein M3P36_01940 [Altererythrobacter sp. KTW20L]|uniref:hypothetical protein n=1 Tax=Altererythrobacter sp. KTW20L TaxID=2942210 RepID=UPI0020BEBBBC|nr:hypothetical protein [Altererythrobacter sp. KTW20L]MCL6249811.1 hypothetical protein [Altererythrobacter sp. KTW20L]